MSGKFSYSPDDWAERIKRYLWARLDSIWINSGKNKHENVMAFLKSLTLAQDDIEWLARLYHVTRDRGAWNFVTRDVPDYFSNLAREQKFAIRIEKGVPRGKILWGQTVRRRLGSSDTSIFVTAVPSRTLNTPENQLIKKYLEKLADVRIPGDETKRGEIGKRLTEAINVSKAILSSHYFRTISSVREVTARMLARANKNRHPLYGEASRLWKEFETIVLDQDLSSLRKILSEGWISPKVEEDVDSLFELFVLVNVLEIMEKLVIGENGGTSEFGLVRRGGSGAVAKFVGRFWMAEVFFDKSPVAVFGIPSENSLYNRILHRYRGLSGASRRPDVLVRLREINGKKEIRILIEAKNTNPTSTYGSDSIYKVLGYLLDYKDIWPKDQRPKVILVFPYGTEPLHKEAFFTEDLAIVSGEIGSLLEGIFAKMMS